MDCRDDLHFQLPTPLLYPLSFTWHWQARCGEAWQRQPCSLGLASLQCTCGSWAHSQGSPTRCWSQELQASCWFCQQSLQLMVFWGSGCRTHQGQFQHHTSLPHGTLKGASHQIGSSQLWSHQRPCQWWSG